MNHLARLAAFACLVFLIGQTPFAQSAPDTIDPEVRIVSPVDDATVGGTVTIEAEASDAGGIGGVWFEIDGQPVGTEDTTAPWTYAWSAAASGPGAHILTAIARDMAGNAVRSAVVTVVVDVTIVDPEPPDPDNKTPNADDDEFVSEGGAAVTFSGATLLANDSDPDGQTVYIVAVAVGSTNGGTVVNNGDGTWTYTPAAGFTGDDFFTYTIEDGAGGTATAPVRVRVTPRQVRVPGVVGQTYSAAQGIITGAGLTVGTVTYETSTVAAGLVMSQSPAADSLVTLPGAVALTVSSGPPTVQVPGVVGQTRSAAESAIVGAGLTVGTVTYETSSVAAGLVIAQSPAGGTTVTVPSAVALTVSSGPPTVQVPGVVGQTRSAAESTIAGAGLTVGTVTYETSSVAAGLVIAQSPTAGTTVTLPSTVTLKVSSGPAAATPAGLVVSLNFDTVSGTTVSDASGLNNHGTIYGAVAAAGKVGGALQFDGYDDWVTVADAASLDLTNGMTLEAWIRPSAIDGWRTVIMKEGAGNAPYYLYANNPDISRPAGYFQSGAGIRGVTGTTMLPADAWTHLAVTYDATNMRLYVNGLAVRTVARAGAINQSAGALRIGGNGVWPAEFFAGIIDEVRVYNRALSGDEITADMNAAVTTAPPPTAPPPPPPPPGGLVLALGFDEAAGSPGAADSSGGGRHGTVTGAATVEGRYGNALSFDGVDDWVTIEGDAGLALGSAMTLEAWIKPTDLNGWRTVLMMENAPSAAYYLYANNPDVNRPAAYFESGSNLRMITGTTALPLGAWRHLAATYDGTNMKIYVNGTLMRTVLRAGPINAGNGPMRIGGNTIWPAEFFQGVIDEVRVYNRALSDTEIQADMSRPVTP
jgi:beta-lactam-binding protein with PASTA domain